MFRQVTAILLLLIFSAQTFSQGVIVLNYFVNTSSFAKDCENKAQPIMHCNGKCQMVKKMKEQEKKEQQSQGPRFNIKSEVISSKSFFTDSVSYKTEFLQIFPSYLNATISKGTQADIFHPPSLV